MARAKARGRGMLSALQAWDVAASQAVFQAAPRPLRPLIFLACALLELSAHGALLIPLLGAFVWALPLPPAAHAFFLCLFAASLADLVLVATIKLLCGRVRPAHNTTELHPSIQIDKLSFPSGHASRATLVAAYCMLAARGLAPVDGACGVLAHDSHVLLAWLHAACASCISAANAGPWLCVWAASVVFSRVLLGRHFVVDVSVGTVLGLSQAVALAALF
mmetsp:Transcript_3355/g.8077  ORF Transcript_3355/g.8077 Transcript_3355/m.8077 type:complete len:220 (+) Transcript_3355:2-661(+)